MNTTTQTLSIALVALLFASGCIIEERDVHDERTTTTTTTTTTTKSDHYEPEPVAFVPDFLPALSSVSADMIDEDYAWGSSWNFYTMNFSDVADTYTCDADMASTSEGSVVTLYVNGFEVDNEFAACPTGSYRIAPDCELREGEACIEILWRDTDGFEAGTDYATDGFVDISLEQGYAGEPHVCHISTSTDAHPDLNFEFANYFSSWELSPHENHTSSICTMRPEVY